MKINHAAVQAILPRWRRLLLFWAILFIVALVAMSWKNCSMDNLLEFTLLAFIQLAGLGGCVLFIFRQRKRPPTEDNS